MFAIARRRTCQQDAAEPARHRTRYEALHLYMWPGDSDLASHDWIEFSFQATLTENTLKRHSVQSCEILAIAWSN